jgi:hypothetical protein
MLALLTVVDCTDLHPTRIRPGSSDGRLRRATYIQNANITQSCYKPS